MFIDIPVETRTLDLRHNFISRLSRSDLQGLAHLETLFLGDNRIRHLDEVFYSLEWLSRFLKDY